jgi:hypothetical protein
MDSPSAKLFTFGIFEFIAGVPHGVKRGGGALAFPLIGGTERTLLPLPSQPHLGWRLLRPVRPQQRFHHRRRRRSQIPASLSSNTTLIWAGGGGGGTKRKPVLGNPPPSKRQHYGEASSQASHYRGLAARAAAA